MPYVFQTQNLPCVFYFKIVIRVPFYTITKPILTCINDEPCMQNLRRVTFNLHS